MSRRQLQHFLVPYLRLFEPVIGPFLSMAGAILGLFAKYAGVPPHVLTLVRRSHVYREVGGRARQKGCTCACPIRTLATAAFPLNGGSNVASSFNPTPIQPWPSLRRRCFFLLCPNLVIPRAFGFCRCSASYQGPSTI